MRWGSIPWEVTSADRREVLIMLYESMRQADSGNGGVSCQVSHLPPITPSPSVDETPINFATWEDESWRRARH